MEFEKYINSLEESLCTLGNVQTKTINYGVQLLLTASGKKVTLNVYNGKKGISLVWGGENSELRDQALELVHQIQLHNNRGLNALTSCENQENFAEPALSETLRFGSAPPRFLLAEEPGFSGVWMGSDESGKGDYFGPLVVAAVCLDRKGGEALLAAGVKDCKALTDEKVLALGKVVQDTAMAVSVLVMKPHIYNMRYNQVHNEGGSLNTLLALGHVAALKQAWQKYPQCKWALVDQFARNNAIPDGVHAFAPDMNVLQRPRAEEDIAVASASVLARAAFLRALQQMAPEAGIGRIPKGGGEAATNAARRLVQKQGMEVLERFVKVHFANTNKLWEVE